MSKPKKPRQLHGESKHNETPEYRAWAAIVKRCTNPNLKTWPRYGGRGITICEEWRKDYLAFLLYVGRRPSPEHSIDRIDNDGNYEPRNVRWATAQEQAKNKSDNVRITFNGKTQCLIDWARELGIGQATLAYRHKTGTFPDGITRRSSWFGKMTKDAGIKMVAISRELGVSKSTAQQWCNGERSDPFTRLKKFLAAIPEANRRLVIPLVLAYVAGADKESLMKMAQRAQGKQVQG